MKPKTLQEYLEYQKKVAKRTTLSQETTKPKYRITGFYKETEFQKTPIGMIPKEWKTIRFHKIFDYTKGKKPNVLHEEKVDGHLPYLTTDYLRTGVPSNYAKLGNNLVVVDEGDILLLWDGSNAGEFFLGKRGILASTMVKLLPKAKDIDLRFYFYFLKMLEPYLKSVTKGTGIPHVEKSVLKSLLLVKPDLKEQWGVAEVLSSVDSAIEESGKLIQKLGRIKKALMHELLTKGIGHKEYKQTPMGKIPKEWRIMKLGEVVALIRNGLTYKDFNRGGLGYPVTRIETIADENINLDKVAYVEKISPKDVEKYKLQIGDILFSHINSVDHLGKVAIYTGEPKLLLHGMNLLLIRPERDKILSKYLFYLLKFYREMGLFKNIAKRAVNQASINQTQLGNLRITLPPLDEQKRIVDVLSSVDGWIDLERRRRERLERLKRGLMSLLLTGRVRVRVEEVS